MKKTVISINGIRPRKDLFIKGIWVEIILECVFILSSIFLDLEMLFFVPVMLLMIVYTYLDFRNTSVTYDQNGITITNFTSRHFFYSWNDVISVQDTYADPRLFKGPTDLNTRRILKIGVRNHKPKTEYLTYFFSRFSGIHQFLDYYECRMKQDRNE